MLFGPKFRSVGFEIGRDRIASFGIAQHEPKARSSLRWKSGRIGAEIRQVDLKHPVRGRRDSCEPELSNSTIGDAIKPMRPIRHVRDDQFGAAVSEQLSPHDLSRKSNHCAVLTRELPS